MITILKKIIKVVICHHQTVVFGSNRRRNLIESFFNDFLKFYENCMISIFPYI